MDWEPEMTKNKRVNPFKGLKLDDYEKELEESFNKGKFVRDKNFKETKKMFEEAAARHLELQKSKTITFRIKN